jgi:hypothetical protein
MKAKILLTKGSTPDSVNSIVLKLHALDMTRITAYGHISPARTNEFIDNVIPRAKTRWDGITLSHYGNIGPDFKNIYEAMDYAEKYNLKRA